MKNLKIIILILTLFLASCSENKETNTENAAEGTAQEANTGSEEKEKYSNSDPLENLKWLYSKDKNNVYYLKHEILWADTESFEVLDYNIAKDKNSAYFKGWKINWSDSETFETLENSYGTYKDKYNVYYLDISDKIQILEWLDSSSVEVVWDSSLFIKDKNYVYYRGKKLEWADSKTFVLLSEGYINYSKDNNSVFFDNEEINWADVETFKLLKYNWYSKDKNHIYYKTDKVEKANPETFKLVFGEYFRDKDNCFSYWKIVDISKCERINDDDKIAIIWDKFKPTDSETKKALELLKNFLEDKQTPENKQIYRKTIFPLERYRVQIIWNSINWKWEKIISAHYFCNEPRDRKEKALYVNDGGSCFFQAKINLNTKKIFDFYINGEA